MKAFRKFIAALAVTLVVGVTLAPAQIGGNNVVVTSGSITVTSLPSTPAGANTIGNVGVNGNSGTPSQTAVSVGVTSTTVLTAAGATSFVKLCLAQSAANGIWVNWAGAAAVAAAPSEYMGPGQCDTWVKSTGYLPTSQINAIASAAVSVTLIHD